MADLICYCMTLCGFSFFFLLQFLSLCFLALASAVVGFYVRVREREEVEGERQAVL